MLMKKDIGQLLSFFKGRFIINIFVLSINPVKAAEYHNNKHVVKMVIESAQLLSSAHHAHESEHALSCYKPSHMNNPLALWTRASTSNYMWLLKHHKALLDEYTHRYGKVHKTSGILQYLEHIPQGVPNIPRTPFHLSMPDVYKTPSPVVSYRRYYIGEKAHIAKWTNREVPLWFSEMLKNV